MKDQLQQRLTELKTEFANGERLLADLDARQQNLRATLLRLSGAIQVLEEMLSQNPESAVVSPRPSPLPEEPETNRACA